MSKKFLNYAKTHCLLRVRVGEAANHCTHGPRVNLRKKGRRYPPAGAKGTEKHVWHVTAESWKAAVNNIDVNDLLKGLGWKSLKALVVFGLNLGARASELQTG